MPSRSKLSFLLLSAVCLSFASAAPAAEAWEPEEDVAGRLSVLNLSPDSSNESVIESAAQSASKTTPGPYRAAIQSIHAWRLLKSGETSDAAKLYEAIVSDPSSPAAFQELARRWLTRIEREKVREALQKAWVRDIEYPANLENLPPPAPPMKDRWNQKWRYRLGSMKSLGASSQRYELQSMTLGDHSDLAAAISLPWPAMPTLSAQSTAKGAGPTVIVFTSSSNQMETVSLSEGRSSRGFALVKIGPKALLIVENDYLFFVRKPEHK